VSSICDNPRGLLTLDQAVDRLLGNVLPIRGEERLPLVQALGRILSADISSPVDLPCFNNSAMDGYALHASEALPGATLRVTGSAFAGRPFAGVVGSGECVRIFTGAPLPEGADAVIVQEEVERQAGLLVLRCSRAVRSGENIRHQGEELKRGEGLLSAGKILRPADLGLLAVAGCSDVGVVPRLRVAFLASGDELAAPGEQLAPGFIYESNRPVLHALLSEMGIEPIDLGRVEDDREAIQRAMWQGVGQADVLITTGGASVGEADHVVELLRELGQVEFWRVAIKPGKPFVFGRLGSTPIFGLPGNPVSMMVTFLQLARPALLRMAGAVATRPLRWRVECRNRLRKSPGRLEFQRGVVDWLDGIPGVTALSGQGSHRLTSMTRANCFIVLPPDSSGAEPGETVEIEWFSELGVFPS